MVYGVTSPSALDSHLVKSAALSVGSPSPYVAMRKMALGEAASCEQSIDTKGGGC